MAEFRTSVLGRRKWLAWRHSRFIPEEITPYTNLIRGWLAPRAGLGIWRKVSCLYREKKTSSVLALPTALCKAKHMISVTLVCMQIETTLEFVEVFILNNWELWLNSCLSLCMTQRPTLWRHVFSPMLSFWCKQSSVVKACL